MLDFKWRYVVIGVIGWAFFVGFIRLLGPAVFSIGSPWLPVMYVVAIPLVFVSTYPIQAAAGTSMRDIVFPVFVITFTAIILDGLAVGFTGIYGATDDQVRASAGILLWGGGWGMVSALILARRAATRTADIAPTPVTDA
ncbi:MAG: hypothetical protein AAF125_15780 [Chloroflexota bacterium]